MPKSKTASPKKDCFAYGVENGLSGGKISDIPKCEALTEMLCENGKCPFYKKRATWLSELYERHGTTNMESIVRSYEEAKGTITW